MIHRSLVRSLLIALAVLPACAPSDGDDADSSGADLSAGGGGNLGSPMATGNGFGFGVYAPKDGVVNAFYMHPTRFLRQNPDDPKGDGVEAPSLVNKLRWKANGLAKNASYASESNVIATTDGTQSFFMPFGLNRPVLIASFKPQGSATSACLDIGWGDGASKLQTKTAGGKSVGTVTFKDETDSVALVPLDGAPKKLDGCVPATAANTWAIIGLANPTDLEAAVGDVVTWQAGASGADLAAREIADHDTWRAAPPAGLSDAEGKLWRQSETIMRMAQIRQPNTDQRHAHGLILASLPAGEWFIPWARDMAYATVALTRMGHRAEAKDALLAYLEAQPVGVVGDLARNVPYQISTVRYFGDGSEEADFTEKGGRNVELDSWGLALWAMSEYFAAYQDTDWLNAPTYRGSVYENARDFVVKPLLGNLDAQGDGQIVAADTGCWEENDQDRQHFAFSTISAIHGLRGFVTLAQAAGDTDTADSVTQQIASLQTGFESAFVRDGRMHGVLEQSKRNDTDGAVLEAINWDVETDQAVIDATLANVTSVLKRDSGGYRRVPGTTSYERHEFLFIDFSLARIYLKLGQPDKAAELVNRTVQRSSQDHDFVPEMYVSAPDKDFPGKVGDPTGAIPMVGYGAGVYTLYMLDRAAGGGPAAK